MWNRNCSGAEYSVFRSVFCSYTIECFTVLLGQWTVKYNVSIAGEANHTIFFCNRDLVYFKTLILTCHVGGFIRSREVLTLQDM